MLAAALCLGAVLLAGTAPAAAGDATWTSEAATAFWTPERMASATPLDGRGKPATGPARPALGPVPHGIRDSMPTAQHFGGVPDIGVLFSIDHDRKAHYCTASVVQSPGRNLILTAGHCGAGSHTAFVPQYDRRATPFGIWAVTRGFRDPRWKNDFGPGTEYDYEFATVAPLGGRRLEDVTGGNTLTRTPSYELPKVTVIGYPSASNDPVDRAITCTMPTKQLPGFHQLQMDCHGYWGGTSGSPWLLDWDGRTGKVIGDIGGYNEGGPTTRPDDMTSYTPSYDDRIFALYDDATHGRDPGTTPSPPPAPLPAPPYSMGTATIWQHARQLASGNFTDGSKKQDLITIWSDYEVTLYTGDGKGGFSGETQLAPSRNGLWNHAVSITAGRFSGSRTDDLVVRWSDGELTLYCGVSSSGFGREVQLLAPNPGWQSAVTVTAGHFAPGGGGNLVARWADGHVSMFDVGTGGIGNERVMIQPNDTWTHAVNVAGADLAGTGDQDLVVRWTDGELTLYPDVDAAGTHREIQLRAPNDDWKNALALTVGDYSADGRPDDLLVVWGNGRVDLFTGTGDGGLGKSVPLVS